MAARVPVSSEVLLWALDRAPNSDAILDAMPKVSEWIAGDTNPTIKQLSDFAARTGTPYGYMFLPAPPALGLPVQDFREGFSGGGFSEPSVNLLAVVHQSVRRQDWYRDYALENGFDEVEAVGRGEGMTADEVAADMRQVLRFEVRQRRGSWSDQRKHLLNEFEALGGLTVTTSMVANNTHRPLDLEEFRGFSLVDSFAPLVFVNAKQTINGQLFTLGHEFAHVWRGIGGISNEDLKWEPQGELEKWCNAVASEFLVPHADLVERFGDVTKYGLTEQLERLSAVYRCGTLVVLHAMRRTGVRKFENYKATYEAESDRLKALDKTTQGDGPSGQFIYNQPFRIGRRLSQALISEALAGRTPFTEATRLMSFKSMKNFDAYAKHLGMVHG